MRRVISLRNGLWACTALVLIGTLTFCWSFVSVQLAARNAADENRDTVDAIIVLGAAQYDGNPSPIFKQRLEAALELYEQGVAPLIVTTGSNRPGDNFTEGFVGFRFLRNNGVPEDSLVVIVDGGNTYESILAASNQLGDSTEAVFVTDAYHALRVQEIGDEVGLTGSAYASNSTTTTFKRALRESIAVSLGRAISYRRLSAASS